MRIYCNYLYYLYFECSVFFRALGSCTRLQLSSVQDQNYGFFWLKSSLNHYERLSTSIQMLGIAHHVYNCILYAYIVTSCMNSCIPTVEKYQDAVQVEVEIKIVLNFIRTVSFTTQANHMTLSPPRGLGSTGSTVYYLQILKNQLQPQPMSFAPFVVFSPY